MGLLRLKVVAAAEVVAANLGRKKRDEDENEKEEEVSPDNLEDVDKRQEPRRAVVVLDMTEGGAGGRSFGGLLHESGMWIGAIGRILSTADLSLQ